MRILLTGASGQLGGALAARLTDHDVVASDRAELDLENSGAITNAIDRTRPHLILNCAAYTAVDNAERETERAEKINGIAPGLLASAAKTVGAGLIHFSTDYVFDGRGTMPYRETDVCNPLNTYGRTKLQGERAIASSGGDCLIIRTAWVYGPKGKNFLQSMLRSGATKPKLRVVADQIGAPTSVLVLASLVKEIVLRMEGKPADYLRRHGGILHATCSGETTWHGFASAIFEEAQKRGARMKVEAVEPIMTAEYPTLARRPAYSVLDLTRLNREYNIFPLPWRDALSQVMDLVAL